MDTVAGTAEEEVVALLNEGPLSPAAEERAVPQLDGALRAEYERLFAQCKVRSERAQAVDQIVDRLAAAKARYAGLETALGTPWYVPAVLHSLESGQRFDRHLHNGDPLTRRTTHVPAGRPARGTPPCTWEASAQDALELKGLHAWHDWSVAGVMFKLEQYNGWGYRQFHPTVLSPYLWSFSQHYGKGKYVADGRFDASAVSQQCGAAVLLRRMADRGMIPLGTPRRLSRCFATPGARWSHVASRCSGSSTRSQGLISRRTACSGRAHPRPSSAPSATCSPATPAHKQSTMTAWKEPCRLVATIDVALADLPEIDGVPVAAGDRVLVAGQRAAAENGVYFAVMGAYRGRARGFAFVEDGGACQGPQHRLLDRLGARDDGSDHARKHRTSVRSVATAERGGSHLDPC